MKKMMAIVMCFCMLISVGSAAYAQTVIEEEKGIAYIIPDTWQCKTRDNFQTVYEHKYDDSTFISVMAGDTVLATMADLSNEFVEDLCNKAWSDEIIASEIISADTGEVVHSTVRTTYKNITREVYGNAEYVRFDKTYIASGYGYYDFTGYLSVFVTAKNGRIYVISYDRRSSSEHFADIKSMLESMSYSQGEIQIKINGSRIYPDSAPLLVEGRTLVPIRAVAEKMGYSVYWDAENQLVGLTDGRTELVFGIGYASYIKNDVEKAIDVAPFIFENRTYLPLRAVAEAMNAEVNWDGASRTVIIDK